ncbi:MAG: hypothetical protein FWG87_02635 [Defluviitaleaceae bacterium]|nr:hypothetical protein [Defluviitaleaceae bacterium]
MVTHSFLKQCKWACQCQNQGKALVGDGLVRPEVASLCVNGTLLVIRLRANLGRDKSLPYN